ncbi:chemotaxis protein CheW [Aureimonas glaciei]|uniref:Chemotaxis protein CheW n=1 Tax=Aureimonas glaciei TaxID=1776957 RepID=A0A917D8Q3_9HYPH|nr:chemotaxis protein CheW [Aureimonas glaciei]GGD08829.1 chemotaxis protein CheW [Aureimonas glaciei]
MPQTRTRESHLLTFRVGATEFAVSAAEVAEVLRLPKLTRVPLAPAGLLGVTSLRGAIVPVVSLAKLLGEEAAPSTASARVLLLQLGTPIGIAVDAVGTLTRMRSDAQGEAAPAAGRLFVQGGKTVRSITLSDLIQREFAGLMRGGGRAEAPSAVVGTARRAEAERVFLTFDLGGQSYALPLDEVAEVLAAPPEIATVPQTDQAMLGVVTLRDALLPIASLGALLGLRPGPADRSSVRIVVARIGKTRVGLLVDRLQTILRAAPEMIDAVPSLLDRGLGEARITSICRLPSGRGLVSILSAERLFRDEAVARLLADTGQETSAMNDPTQKGAVEQVLVFQLGAEEYALPVSAVGEVMRLPDRLTRVPRAPSFVEGVMNHRGKALPVIDQRRRFDIDGESVPERRRVIVTTIGGLEAGFVVDSVSQILGLTPDQLRPTPEMTADGASLFSRVADLGDGRLVLLIEPRELLDRAERDLLAALDTGDAVAT